MDAILRPIYRNSLLFRSCALAFGVLGFVLLANGSGRAQETAQASADSSLAPGGQMLVEADQIVYDYDHNQVSAVGNVVIYQQGYTLQAEKVTYFKQNGRLIASGHVKVVDPTGTAFYTEQFDATDNFRDGFIGTLRVETPQKTRFAAAHAERSNGEITTFYQSVYTACEPCKEHPEKPALWQVKAAKIIMNHKKKMIYFHNARLEFFGKPVAYFPYFSTPDPSVKRKSGFLQPGYSYSKKLGWGVSIPYFWALAPNYDLTFTATPLTRQGVLGEVEWRHRLSNGQYTVKIAGIHQGDSAAFLDSSSDYTSDWRGGVRTAGEFNLSPYWTYGWDITASTDNAFTKNYKVLNSDDFDHDVIRSSDRPA